MKNEYELLKNLFSGNQMPEIVRYNDEYRAIGSEDDFIDMIWYEVQEGGVHNKEERNRIFKNSIILSSRLSAMDQDLNGLTLLDLTLNIHFSDFEKDNGSFTTRQLLEFVAYSNNLVWGYYYEGNDKFTVENLGVIHRLHQTFWTSIKGLSKTKVPNYLACTYFKKNYICPPDKSEHTQFQFLKKERIEELVIYISFSISYIINFEELEKRNLIKHEEFLTELKSMTKDLKEDYETDNDIFDDVYAQLLEVEDKPSFNKLLILLLNKNHEDMYEYDVDDNTKQKLIDIFNMI
jgi:hypothetical protein